MEGSCPNPVGSWPYGPSETGAVSEDFVIFASGSMLQVADRSNPDQPVVVGELILPAPPSRVAISGNRALIVIGWELLIVDLSVPWQPSELGTFAFAGEFADIDVNGATAYLLVNEPSQVLVIDFSDPESPVEIGRRRFSGAMCRLIVSGSTGYLLQASSGFEYFYVASLIGLDLSNPRDIVELGRWKKGIESFHDSGPLDLVLTEHTALVVANYIVRFFYADVFVVDISDAAHMQEIASFTVDPIIQMASAGTTVYLAGWSRILAIDLAVPSDPLFSEPYGMEAMWAAAIDDSAYVAIPGGDLVVIAGDGYGGLAEVGRVDYPGASRGIALRWPYVFLTVDAEPRDKFGVRLMAFDVSDPAQPTSVGRGIAIPRPTAIVAYGNSVITVGWHLRVIDVSDPLNPILLGDQDLGFRANGVAVKDGFAFVTSNSKGLTVFDVTIPSEPHEVGSFAADGLSDVALSGIYAYVVGPFTGLVILDISDPTQPETIGGLADPGRPYRIALYRIALNGDIAYLARYKTFLAVDVSDPRQPQLIHEFAFDIPVREVQDIVVNSGRAVVIERTSGPERGGSLILFDLSQPAEPVGIGRYFSPTTPTAVVVDAGFAYLANGRAGMAVFDISSCLIALPRADFEVLPTQSGVLDLIRFVDTSSGSVADWNWDFGDGAVSHLQNPTHYFSTPGRKIVSLTVGSSLGKNSVTRSILVSAEARRPRGRHGGGERHISMDNGVRH